MRLYSRTVKQLRKELKKFPQNKDVNLYIRLNKSDIDEIVKWKEKGGGSVGFEFSIFTIEQDNFGDVDLNGFDPSGSSFS